jgi:Dyp-type peroxidase family
MVAIAQCSRIGGVGMAAKLPKAELELRTSTNIQGNILAPFNKPHQAFLFVNFRNDKERARSWLAELCEHGPVASTNEVASRNDEFKAAEQNARQPQQWLAVSLTRSGLVTLHPELAADLAQFEAFWAGPLGTRRDRYGGAAVTTTAALLGDEDGSDPSRWVIGGPRQEPVDALVTLAADDHPQNEEQHPVDELLEALVECELKRAKNAGLLELWVQRGHAIRGTGNWHQDHFGFREGVSQPGVLGFTRQPDGARKRRLEDAQHPGSPIIATGEFLLGYLGERRLDLAARPLRVPGWMQDGSFQVFRRLTQNPSRWNDQMAELERVHRIPSSVLKAKAIGRHPNGCPLAPEADCDPEDKNPNKKTLNDFDYSQDVEGVHTPLFAHIRKVNPRDNDVYYRAHRLLRRGIPFDDTKADRDEATDLGMLFNAFMASIEDQFEFIQRSWANSPRSPRGTADGPDALIGKGGTRRVLRLQDTTSTLQSSDDHKQDTGAVYTPPRLTEHQLDFGQFVHTTGAVYAFAPSIEALKLLADEGPIPSVPAGSDVG